MSPSPTLPAEILDDPKALVVPSPESFAPNVRVTQEDYRTYLAEAQQIARLGFTRRFSVSIVGPDSPGVLAAVTGPIADQGWNVEAASVNVLARRSLLMITVSAKPPTSKEQVEILLKPVKDGLKLEVSVVAVETAPSLPIHDYLQWHLFAHVEDRPGVLHDVASVLFEPHRCWLTNFSTHITSQYGRRLCVLDINAVVPPRADLAGLSSDMNLLRQRINYGHRVPQWEFSPVAELTHRSTPSSEPPQPARFALSITAPARSGLVAAITGVLGKYGYNIVGSAMAILEERTAFIALLDHEDRDVTKAKLEVALETLRDEHKLEIFVSELSHRTVRTRASQQQRPNVWHFYGLVREHPGVISTIADIFRQHDANVTAMLARVVGDPAACVVNADVILKKEWKAKDARAELSVLPWINMAWERPSMSQRRQSLRAY